MLRPILKYGDAGLHAKAEPVAAITSEIQSLIDDMIETMYAAPGIGLAATQVGVPLRIFVIDISLGRDPGGLITVVNPEFVERDGMYQAAPAPRFSRSGCQIQGPAPSPGQHTSDVLADWGFSAAEIRSLRDGKAVA